MPPPDAIQAPFGDGCAWRLRLETNRFALLETDWFPAGPRRTVPPSPSAVRTPGSARCPVRIHVPRSTSPRPPVTPSPRAQGETAARARCTTSRRGTGAHLVLLHTVRTQAEHYRSLIPLIADQYTVYALDLPGMGYSEIVPGTSYDEPAMRAGVERFLTELDLHDVTLVGESMGAVLALTTAADLPERVRLPQRDRPLQPPRPRGGQRRPHARGEPRDRRGGAQARTHQDPSGRPGRPERTARGLRGRAVPGGPASRLPDRRPERVPGPAQPHRRPLTLPRDQGTHPPRLRREGLAPALGPAGQQAAAAGRRLHAGAESRPLHRLERPDVLVDLLNAVA
ncbi:alpha/beta fold hydrolase [Streptomyces sp. NPDC005356]|uniref:alpha/beta hydrolase n=1 Tax=Streptomyces sp. NPDC005356 TaxID=3157167 RepID=UPI0033BA56A0